MLIKKLCFVTVKISICGMTLTLVEQSNIVSVMIAITDVVFYFVYPEVLVLWS